MSFDQDPNEQANISGADLAILIDELHEVKQQRDTAWQEMREIREAIAANTEESTADEVRRAVAQRDELLAALKKIISDGDYTAPEGMKRIAREAIAKAEVVKP